MNISPNIPKNRIKRCLIGAKYTEEIYELNQLGVECIELQSKTHLDDEINSHADILCFNCGNGTIITETLIAGELSSHLNDFNIIPCKNIKSPYPDDVKLNAALIGNNLICNLNFVADEIKTFCKSNGIKIIHSNQGYSKCSLCVVTEKAIITEDDGLAYLLKNCQFDVLKIQPGFVQLSDKHYGFIGGASGKISENQIYFSGDLSKHPDYNNILNFLNKYNVEPIYNKNRNLTDFGGFIQI